MSVRAPVYSSEKGMTVVEALLAVAIVGVSAVLLMDVTSRSLNLAKSGELMGEYADLRNYLKNTISCEHTIKNSGCSGNTKLRDRNNNLIPKRIGDFAINTRCASLPGSLPGVGLTVWAQLVGADGKPRRDPVSENPSKPQKLFDPVPFPCRPETISFPDFNWINNYLDVAYSRCIQSRPAGSGEPVAGGGGTVPSCSGLPNVLLPGYNGDYRLRYDNLTARKVCALAGYKTVADTRSFKYKSCGDNGILYWTASGWTSEYPACANDVTLDRLACSTPIEWD